MEDLFNLCHTELPTNVSLFIRKMCVLFWICTHYPPCFYVIDCSYFWGCLLYVLIFNSFAFVAHMCAWVLEEVHLAIARDGSNALTETEEAVSVGFFLSQIHCGYINGIQS
jgi:hypothetical protein